MNDSLVINYSDILLVSYKFINSNLESTVNPTKAKKVTVKAKKGRIIPDNNSHTVRNGSSTGILSLLLR